MPRQRSGNRGGYVLLINVLIISAIGMSIALGLLTMGTMAARRNFLAGQSLRCRAIADACAEQALQAMRSIPGYIGSGSLTLGGGSCTYTVADTGGNTRRITVGAALGTVVRRLTIDLDDIVASLHVSLWQETQ